MLSLAQLHVDESDLSQTSTELASPSSRAALVNLKHHCKQANRLLHLEHRLGSFPVFLVRGLSPSTPGYGGYSEYTKSLSLCQVAGGASPVFVRPKSQERYRVEGVAARVADAVFTCQFPPPRTFRLILGGVEAGMLH